MLYTKLTPFNTTLHKSIQWKIRLPNRCGKMCAYFISNKNFTTTLTKSNSGVICMLLKLHAAFWVWIPTPPDPLSLSVCVFSSDSLHCRDNEEIVWENRWSVRISSNAEFKWICYMANAHTYTSTATRMQCKKIWMQIVWNALVKLIISASYVSPSVFIPRSWKINVNST